MIQHFIRPFRIIWFMMYFLYEVLRANFIIFTDIISPKMHIGPGIVKLPLDSRTDFEITMIAVLISITPGTRVIAIKKDPAALYVHGIYAKNKDEFRNKLHKEEQRMIKALRLPKDVVTRDKV